jgi:hypothetical protein
MSTKSNDNAAAAGRKSPAAEHLPAHWNPLGREKCS